MDVLTSETCRAVNSEIIKQVTSSWSIFIQLNYVSLRSNLWYLVRAYIHIIVSRPYDDPSSGPKPVAT